MFVSSPNPPSYVWTQTSGSAEKGQPPGGHCMVQVRLHNLHQVRVCSCTPRAVAQLHGGKLRRVRTIAGGLNSYLPNQPMRPVIAGRISPWGSRPPPPWTNLLPKWCFPGVLSPPPKNNFLWDDYAPPPPFEALAAE